MATSRSSRDDKLLTKTEQQEQEQEQQEIISKDDDAHNSNDITLLQKQPITNDQLLTNVFDPSKIKNFLYKEEPNMARLNGPSLDLISTTAALLLKSIVEKAIRLDNDNGSSSSLQQQQQQQQQRNNKEGDKGPPEQILITSTHLKRLISSSNPSLEFLQETYENVIDKDGSARVSSLREYIPAVKKVKVKQVNKRGAAAHPSSSIINQTDNSKDENNNNNSNNSKRRRKTDSGTYRSSAFIDNNTNNKDNSLFSSDDAPLKKAIADATNTKESRMLDKIIADEDDYD
ncbi:hypothetical protein FRACYDRAFT_234269 [Fragilariopsis cylindrus CCMP1102]|uniref:Uncharacterized protein n=1 Tax=Fragilariopsis cylindrus CCMP1102 TaxID=635003 RepID=A0A1E7FR58_9STRA|nr:hypothetical protein FRACYDRAFT_234269 [Fragilariopsis cylindrus CCMP1102]|eukprot:OEU20636.1 hypothetical protein FRACYDRAFT_234269 [Fragilariopsis cylindrus CCMP1102]